MTEKITYYAIIDEHTSRDRPRSAYSGVSRVTKAQIDETFSRDLKWEFSPLLYSAERGDTMLRLRADRRG